MDTTKTIAGTALILALASLGVTLSDDNPLFKTDYNITDNSYFCVSKELPYECVRFSEPNKEGISIRCYPHEKDNIGYRDCKEGWLNLEVPKDKELNTIELRQDKVYLVCDEKQTGLIDCKQLSNNRRLIKVD